MITAIVMPTPRRLKKAIKDFNLREKIKREDAKERIVLYGIITGGIVIAIKEPVPAKALTIGTLIYYGISYEVLRWWYEKYGDYEEVMSLLRNYNYNAVFLGRQIFL